MRRVALLVVGLLVLQVMPASAAPDVVKQKECTDAAGVRLELTKEEEDSHSPTLTEWRFEVHRSPVGHEWRIRLVTLRIDGGSDLRHRIVIFRGARVASDGGDLVVEGRGRLGHQGTIGRASDRQTGEFCSVKIGPDS